MQLPRRPRRRPQEPVVPLINVVFLLLVFFLIAGTFRGLERFEVEPPTSRLGEDAAAPERVLLLTRDGRLALAGDELSTADAVARLEPGTPLRLRADARARARDLLPLLESLYEAGIREIEFVTREVD